MNRAPSIGRAIRGAAAAIAFLLILAPILIVVVTAFSPTDYFQFPPPGLSLRWFVEFFRLDNMRNAFLLSILVLSWLVVACGQPSATPDASAEATVEPMHAPATDVVAPATEVAAPTPEQSAEVTGAEPVVRKAPAPAPRFVVVDLPAGTELEVELLDSLSSGTSRAGDPVRPAAEQVGAEGEAAHEGRQDGAVRQAGGADEEHQLPAPDDLVDEGGEAGRHEEDDEGRQGGPGAGRCCGWVHGRRVSDDTGVALRRRSPVAKAGRARRPKRGQEGG